MSRLGSGEEFQLVEHVLTSSRVKNGGIFGVGEAIIVCIVGFHMI